MSDLNAANIKRVTDDEVYEPIQIFEEVKSTGDDYNKTEVYSKAISKGSEIVNKVLDIVQIREERDASLLSMDKQMELVERTTEAEIKKMLAQTDNWEKRFKMVSGLLQEMTITVTTNKDLAPEVAKSMVDTVKAMVANMSKE